MPKPPNVILIAVDTLRAGHLGCYGYGRDTSPNIDRWLADKGVFFERHSGGASYTHPSFTTMLTGHFPLDHGVVVQGTPVPPREGIPMLAELMEAGGYYTAAVDSLGKSAKGGRNVMYFRRGFKRYVHYPSEEPPSPRREGKRNGMNCVNAFALPVIEELEKRQPFFLFLHVWDPHRAYQPRPPFSEKFVTGREPNRVNFSTLDKATHPEEPKGMGYTIAQYDGAIADCDDALGEFFARVDDLGLGDDTAVVLTSDHGESLGEHRIYCRHAGIYQATMHVPLILRYPPRLPTGEKRTLLTMHVDIAPTILAFAGLGGGEEMAGMSLVDVATGASSPKREAAFAHTINPDTRRAARTERYKFLQHVAGCPREAAFPERELYDLAKDPGETRNLAEELPDVTKRMEKLMDRWVSENLARAGHPDPMVAQRGGEGTVSRIPLW